MKGIAAVASSLLLSAVCLAGPQYGSLNVSAVPEAPVLLTAGTGGGLSVPYFVVNSIDVSWTGAGRANLTAVKLVSHGAEETIDCEFTGDGLRALFPDDVDARGVVVVTPGTPVASIPVGCNDLKIANVNQPYFNIPVDVIVSAVISGGGNVDLRKVAAKTEIILQ